MRRLEVITLIGGTAIAGPLGTHEQQPMPAPAFYAISGAHGGSVDANGVISP